MTRILVVVLTAFALATASIAVLPRFAEATPVVITFASGTDWQVFDADPATGPANLLGFAQQVCLNASFPSPCPAGATLYGFVGGGWSASLATIPGATWIWAPGITGATIPAFPAQYYFSKTFSLLGTPLSGSLSVGADDFAEVRVNGSPVGTVGSTTNFTLATAAQSGLTSFNITSLLVPGSNTITIRAANGAFGCVSGTYSCNPAAVVFGGSIEVLDINDLETLIEGFGLPQGIANSLLAKVDAAQASLARGNTTAACNQLQALINEAQAQSGKHLMADQAAAIVNTAQAIRTSLGCS